MILFLRRKLTDNWKKTFRKQQPKRKTPGYENDEPDYEDEEIAGYMDGDDDTGLAKVAELLGRNEAERNISEEHEAFDMNDFL